MSHVSFQRATYRLEALLVLAQRVCVNISGVGPRLGCDVHDPMCHPRFPYLRSLSKGWAHCPSAPFGICQEALREVNDHGVDTSHKRSLNTLAAQDFNSC